MIKQVFIFMSIYFHLSKGNEINHLLSFKTLLQDPTHSLSNWNKSTPLCNWNGITCSPTNTNVLQINLSTKNLTGEISPSLFRLARIESIDLSSNQLQGEIPYGLFSCHSLKNLNLSNNNLTGRVPDPGLAPSSALETFDLCNNMISGTIPENLGWLHALRYLDLGGNLLVGQIPKSIVNLTDLEYLTLASNQITGEIPNELGNLRRLKFLYLGYNKLSGIIPNEIGLLQSLNHLDLVYNNLSGSIPQSFGNLTNLQDLYLYQNQLNGTIPPSIFSIKTLISLDLSDNYLSGEIPNLTNLQNLQVLHLFSNNLTGKIPNSISSLPKLQILQLWSNKLHGQIPQNLGKNNNLTILDLSTNSLTGKIPNSLCTSGNLHKLILFSNSLEGIIPTSLGSCHSLQRIRLQNNSLSGRLPHGFTNLENVYFFDISNNNLSGKVDHSSWHMPALQMLNLAENNFVGGLPELSKSVLLENLDLSGNHFSGIIPSGYGKLFELMNLQLGRNHISGVIPEELAACKKLVTLDVSHNRLTGPVPYGLGQMPVLGRLDLSDNQLSGEIPRNLGSVYSLVEVNISYNHFHGVLPTTAAFLAINSSDVTGNDLCGGDHLTNGLPPCQVVKDPTSRTWWDLSIALGAAIVVVGFFVCVYVYMRRRNNKSFLKVQRVENEQGIWEVHIFDPKGIKLITNNIHDIISKGNSSSLMKYNDDEMEFVVEELSVNNLWDEVLQFGKIKHVNIVRVLGACKGEKGGFLIHEKVEQGVCLSEVLQGLNWARRRKIALGVAKALKFLHYNCSPSILVGEMSPERVVVGSKDGEARLKLGVCGLFCLGPKSFLSSPYVAPETKEAKEITEKNDIYGFGLILIELLTGRGLTDAELGAHNDVIGWAQHCYSDCHLDSWIDPVMMNENKLNNENEIVEIMNLALQCTARDPTARPCAIDLVKIIDCSSYTRTSRCVMGIEIPK